MAVSSSFVFVPIHTHTHTRTHTHAHTHTCTGSWKVVRPLLNKVTVSKVQFVEYGNASAVLHEIFPQDLAQWCLTESSTNRLAGADTKKHWEWRDPAGNLL